MKAQQQQQQHIMTGLRRHSFSVPSLPGVERRRRRKFEEDSRIQVVVEQRTVKEEQEEPHHDDAVMPLTVPASSSALPTTAVAAVVAVRNVQKKKDPATRRPLPSPQPHTTTAHFLRGINLEQCDNLLSIPDPPCSSKNSDQNNNTTTTMDHASPATTIFHSTLSSPIIPLKDRTNQRNNNDNDGMGGTCATVPRRRTLCHVPTTHAAANASKNHNNKEDHHYDADQTHQGRTRMQQYYLQGLQDDDEIPRPTSSARRKRRETMLFLPPADAHVEQPPQHHDDDDDDKYTEVDNVTETPVALATRQDSDDDDDMSLAVSSSSVDDQQRQQDSVPLLRHRKRKSMVLPSDAGDAADYLEQLYDCKKTDAAEVHVDNDDKAVCLLASSSPETVPANKNEELTPRQMGHVRQLVRQYCSIPLDERDTSWQAREIERLTGYSLIPPAAKRRKQEPAGVPSTEQVTLFENYHPQDCSIESIEPTPRRQLLAQLGNLVEVLDSKKTADTETLHAMTECRVERSRTGKCRYYHVKTNESVKAREFQARYETMLEQVKPVIRTRVLDWLNKYSGDSSVGESEALHSSSEDDVAQVASLDQGRERDAGEECSTSVGRDSMEVSADDLYISIRENSDDDEEEGGSGMREEGVSASSPSESSGTTLEQEDGRNEDSSGASGVVLPLRDETSSDPEIAAAEERLWAALDAALETYSSEVLAIQAARRNGGIPLNS